MRIWMRSIMLFLVFGIILLACNNSEGRPARELERTGGMKMVNYPMGRFSIDVPAEMTQAVQAQTLRYVEIEEFVWPKTHSRETVRKDIWKSHLGNLRELKAPKNIKSVVIEEQDISVSDKWAKAVLYYGDHISNDTGYWDVLVDNGDVGIWLKYNGVLNEKDAMLKWIKEIAAKSSSYTNCKGLTAPFFLKHSVIDLSFLEEEKTYARFEGHPLDLKVEVEMNETHEVVDLGMAERLAASIATRYMPGVNIDKIRSCSRTAAGLLGEELVMRMSASGEEPLLQFVWEYRGKVDSGDHPEIQITMEASDGQLNEKLMVWDSVIQSFKAKRR